MKKLSRLYDPLKEKHKAHNLALQLPARFNQGASPSKIKAMVVFSLAITKCKHKGGLKQEQKCFSIVWEGSKSNRVWFLGRAVLLGWRQGVPWPVSVHESGRKISVWFLYPQGQFSHHEGPQPLCQHLPLLSFQRLCLQILMKWG